MFLLSGFSMQLHKLRSQLRGSIFISFHFRSSYIYLFHIHHSHSSLSREHMNPGYEPTSQLTRSQRQWLQFIAQLVRARV